MKVLFVSSEVSPFVKTGGLAEWSFALPKALKAKGIDVRIIMPKYSEIIPDYDLNMIKLDTFGVQVGWRNQSCQLLYMEYEGIPVYFIDNEYYFNRPGCYGYFDDGERFSYYNRAVMESVQYMEDFSPDIIHCNDWHTGIIPVLLRDFYYDKPLFSKTRCVFTIHNLKYQGVFSPLILQELLGMEMGYFTEDKLKYKDGISFMKAGISYADMVTTVSPTYAKEIQQPYYGEGFDAFMREKRWKLCGIVNGIDFDFYNPDTDKDIVSNFNSGTINKKAVNKLALQKKFGLQINDEIPLIGVVTKLIRQKGLDLITCVMEDLLKMDVQLVIIGEGDSDYQDYFKYYASTYPDKISANICSDDSLEKTIYAGADMFLMPSLLEPCGDSQLIAMRYGTIPIVRETGGLKDTIISYNEFTSQGNGFSFENFNAYEMLDIIKYAISMYVNKKTWNNLIASAMNVSYSLENTADEYVELYERAMI